MNRTQTSELPRNGEDLRRQIAQRAYALYEQRGRQSGFAMQDWLQAEQELAHTAERPAKKLLLEQSDLKIDRSIALGFTRPRASAGMEGK